jgi:peptide/nickel transport system permease protein
MIFILLRISPGSFTQKFISPDLSPTLADQVKTSFGLNEPIPIQYKNFLTNLIRGDFGVSYSFREPVSTVIFRHLPLTAVIAFSSFLIQILIGILLASFVLKKSRIKFDKFFSSASIFVFALPSFVVGVFLLMIFSDLTGLFPSSGIKSFDFDQYNFIGKLLDYFHHLVLPVFTISLGGTALFYKYASDNMKEISTKYFITNLRANGVGEKTIILKHIIPNSISPLISAAGVELGILLGGTLITEVIFSLPGMGRLTVNAILQRDYPLVIGCVFISGVLIILSNFLADLIKGKMDKRMIKEMLG